MSNLHKAIAAFLSSLVAMLAAFGVAVPETLTPENIWDLVQAGALAVGIVTGGVYVAPANKRKT